MARLSEPQKVEIVRLLGAGATPPQVAARMRENHGITVDRFQIRAYDASGPRFEGGAHLSDLFWEQREAYQNELASRPPISVERIGAVASRVVAPGPTSVPGPAVGTVLAARLGDAQGAALMFNGRILGANS